MRVDTRERVRIVVGAAIGIAFTAWLSHLAGGSPEAGLLMAGPIGASAVLVFGVPASPLAQPWSVIGGNTVSALAGMLVVHALGAPTGLSAAAAVALAIAAMFALRCLHPPGGAMALTMVLGHTASMQVAAFPVLTNSLLLVVAGIAYNGATRRRYPHRQQEAVTPQAPRSAVVSTEDIEAALARYNQVVDLPSDDLQALVRDAEMHAYQRRLGSLRCDEVMSRDLAAVAFGTSLEEAWAMMRERRIKALPVIDRARRVVGIVTLSDFMREAQLDLHRGFDAKLLRLIRRITATHSDKAEVVGQIMTRQVRVTRGDRPLAELVPLFASTGHHHVPVIDEELRIVGMLTQSDVVAAVCAPSPAQLPLAAQPLARAAVRQPVRSSRAAAAG
jgi:CBS domain-containing membrane protein